MQFESKTAGVQRRQVLLAAAGTVAAGVAPGVFAQARSLASGPARIVVPFTPGTTPDLCARLIAPAMAKRLGQNVIVENRPGASGIIGMESVAKAAPDGTTVMLTSNTTLTLPFFYQKMSFDVLQSFTALGMLGNSNFALVAHPSFPANTPRELIAYVKARPDQVDYASPGKGTLHHLCMEKIAHDAGLKMRHIPYKGTAGAMTDIVGGQVKLMVLPLHIAAGLQADNKLKIIGATRKERDPAFPRVPTLHEGGITGFDEEGWYGLWGPRGMPADLVALYNASLRDALAIPESKVTLDKQGVAVTPSAPEELRKIAQAEHDRWGRVIKEANIQAE
ncbi:MAG TPA: tripartite tricarboxylate transporter substrate binding protein [Ramlibacter sp.]|jgi:tripartite-type tricarboxylate transporter receptor subunit TctC|nr:tripartite tricarboxylate transporter substrate binding protein [Ramlibacter sp.]